MDLGFRTTCGSWVKEEVIAACMRSTCYLSQHIDWNLFEHCKEKLKEKEFTVNFGLSAEST